MANMSYCRMQNTARDLQDCIWAIEEGEYNNEIDMNEKQGLEEIVNLAHRIINELEYDIEKILSKEDD